MIRHIQNEEGKKKSRKKKEKVQNGHSSSPPRCNTSVWAHVKYMHRDTRKHLRVGRAVGTGSRGIIPLFLRGAQGGKAALAEAVAALWSCVGDEELCSQPITPPVSIPALQLCSSTHSAAPTCTVTQTPLLSQLRHF